jgi:hypothetical protein
VIAKTHDDVSMLREAMRGRWRELLPSHEYPPDHGRPCPRCQGKDRFNFDKDFNETGAVWCRQCFGGRAQKNHGDGFSALVWWHGITFPEALQMVRNLLGYSDSPGIDLSTPPESAIERYCTLKKIPSVESLKAYGARIGRWRGGDIPVIEVPMRTDPNPDAVGSMWVAWPTPIPDLGEKLADQVVKGINDGSQGLFVPVDGIRGPGPVLIVEGVKDASTLWHHGYRQTIGVPGNPSAKLGEALRRFLSTTGGSVPVVCVTNLDRSGQKIAQRVAELLDGFHEVRSVQWVRLPGGFREIKGIDVRDAIGAAGLQAVRCAIENPVEIPWEERPKVLIDPTEEMHKLCQVSAAHLASVGWSTPWIPRQESARLYRQGSQLVEVIWDAERKVRSITIPEGPRPRPISRQCLLTKLDQSARFYRQKVDVEGNVEWKRTDPPSWVVTHLMEDENMMRHHFAELRGIISAPTLRTDGTILQTPGYDAESGLLLLDGEYLPVPEKPTRHQVDEAVAELRDLLCEFPWDGEPEENEAAWMAYTFTLLARHAVRGCVPMFAFSANEAGSGKGLLVEIANRIAFGRNAAVRAYDPCPTEARKAITACLVEGLAAVCWDNVRPGLPVANSSLEGAITSEVWSERELGTNKKTITLPQSTVFSVTGNQLAFGGDMRRRLVCVALRSNVANPEARKIRRPTELKVDVMTYRPRLVRAVLTCLRYRWSEGKVDEGGNLVPILQPIGSFEGWSAVIRDAVYLATGVDPWATNKRVDAVDEDRMTLQAIYDGFEAAREFIIDADEGITTAQLVQLLATEGVAEMVDALGFDPNKRVSPSSLGQRFRAFKDRVLEIEGQESQRFEGKPSRSRAIYWRFRPVRPIPPRVNRPR